MEKVIIAGIDEAGLGPILGPYTAGLTLFEVPQENNLFNLLHPFIQKRPHKDGLALADSKALFSQSSGIAELEKTLLAFYCLHFPFPQSLNDFFNHLLLDQTPWVKEKAPWYGMLKDFSLPMEADQQEILHWTEILKIELQQRDIRFLPPRLSVTPALRFNELLLQHHNKSLVCQKILSPLILESLEHPVLELTVDRQGGRRFYGEWLMELLPGKPLAADRELKALSRYHSKEQILQFMVEADAQHLETALASMFAKYAREGVMTLFNRFWQKRYPDLKATAGYYKDGKRFLRELALKQDLPEFRNYMERLK